MGIIGGVDGFAEEPLCLGIGPPMQSALQCSYFPVATYSCRTVEKTSHSRVLDFLMRHKTIVCKETDKTVPVFGLYAG